MNTFTEDQMSDIILWLEKWNLPIKYAYMTPIGDTAWTEIEKNRNNSWSVFLDSSIFTQSIETYLNDMNNPEEIIVIDIGGWVGFTSKPIIESLQYKSIKTQYHTIDISEEMIQKNKRHLSSILDVEGHLLDIEQGGIRSKIKEIKNRNPNIPILVTILWSTIGNFPEARALLRQIESALWLIDRIIVGTQIYHEWQESQITKIYNNDESAIRMLNATINNLWIQIDGNYNFRWNTRETMIEWGITLNKDTVLSIWNKQISFENEEYIRLLESRKYNTGWLIQLAGNMRIAVTKSDIRWKFMQVMFAPYRQ